MLLICYPKCSTCKKAETFLRDKGIKYEYRDIKENNPTKDELREWIKTSQLPIKRFFNTSGQVYRSLNIKDKLPSLTEEEQLELLATDGMLVKRPLLIDKESVLVGFKEGEWIAHFSKN